MKLKKLTKTIGLCGVLLSTYSIPSFAWDKRCDASCPKNIFGGSDLACNLWHGANCGIEVPKIPTLDDLLKPACASVFKTVTNVIYNNCIRASAEGLTDINNAPRNLKLAAAILNDLGFYRLQDFNNVKISSCASLDSGTNGMVPVPDRIVLDWSRFYHDDGYALAPLLGHEMRHIQQIRELGYEGFACGYSGEWLRYNTGEGNSFEKEGYNLERDIYNLLLNYSLSASEEDALINNFLNPPVPPPPPTQEQINAALTAINALLLEDDPCSFKLSQTSVTAPNTAGNYTVNVTTDASCDWKVTSNVNWLSSSSSGKGNGTLNYNVTATDAYNNRTGIITLTSSNGGNQTLTVTQSPKIKETMAIANASVYEGKTGTTTTMNFNVTLSTPATKTINVTYRTANISASSSDYSSTSGTLTFYSGESSKNIAVKIYGDATKENNETFSVTLRSPTSPYTLSTSKVTGTILNDD